MAPQMRVCRWEGKNSAPSRNFLVPTRPSAVSRSTDTAQNPTGNESIVAERYLYIHLYTFSMTIQRSDLVPDYKKHLL